MNSDMLEPVAALRLGSERTRVPTHCHYVQEVQLFCQVYN